MENISSGPNSKVFLIRGPSNKLCAKKAGIIYPSEINILRYLVHPNIIEIIDFSLPKAQSEVSITMPLASGTLSELIHKKILNYDIKIRIAYDLLTTIYFIHNQGILHLDLKPDNILYQGSVSNPKILISDFGLSAYYDVGSDGYRTTQDKITQCYRPPEAFTSNIKIYNEKSDIWSLGIIFLQLFSKSSYKINENLSEEGSINKYLNSKNEKINKIIVGMLKINPEERLTIHEILESSLFNNIDYVPTGGIRLPERNNLISVTSEEKKYQNEGLNVLLHKIWENKKIYKSPVSIIFLAVDLYSRSLNSPKFKLGKTIEEYKIKAQSCIDLSIQLIQNTTRTINKEMWNIVHELDGLLYPQYLYFHIWGDNDLLIDAYSILRNLDSYNNLNLEKYLEGHKINNTLKSTLTIKEYSDLLMN